METALPTLVTDSDTGEASRPSAATPTVKGNLAVQGYVRALVVTKIMAPYS